MYFTKTLPSNLRFATFPFRDGLHVGKAPMKGGSCHEVTEGFAFFPIGKAAQHMSGKSYPNIFTISSKVSAK